MSALRVAILGGDGREVHVAERLAEDGHEAVRFGQVGDTGARAAVVAGSAAEAVRGAQWVVCPLPGLDGSRVYAPGASTPILLDAELLELSDAASGGLVLGRTTDSLAELTGRLGIPVFEMKDDLGLATRLSTGVAEGVLRHLIEITRRILREHRIVLVGYGVTGAVILDYLLAARCEVEVAARNPRTLERIRQCGAIPVPYDERRDAMVAADIVINTVPSRDAVPGDIFEHLRGTSVVDIASPPGGLDHAAAGASGVVVHWLRGLAGGRAPLTAGDAQYAFLTRVMSQAGQAGAGAADGATERAADGAGETDQRHASTAAPGGQP